MDYMGSSNIIRLNNYESDSIIDWRGIIKHRSISKAYKYYRLKNKIDYSLVSSKIYLGGKSTDDESIKVAKTPKVWVIDDETIHIQNLTGISDKLSTFKSELTAMLKDSYIVNTYQLDKSANYYIVELVEMSEKIVIYLRIIQVI